MKKIPLVSLLFFALSNVYSQSLLRTSSASYGFIENKGQVTNQFNQPNPNVLYTLTDGNLHVQLHRNGFSYELFRYLPDAQQWQVSRVDIVFEGANSEALIETSGRTNSYINYYKQEDARLGTTKVHHFNKIVYRNVYPSIDIEFVLNDQPGKSRFKYDLVVHPGGDLDKVQMKVNGATGSMLNEKGQISMQTTNGVITETIPFSYQPDATGKTPVAARFVSLHENVFGISAESYNTSRTLVIDPAPWSTYCGGTETDGARAVALDNDNNVIISGSTTSIASLATSGAFQTTLGGLTDMFTAKFNENGNLLWATYYGGDGHETDPDNAVDADGCIYVTGWAGSGSVATTPTTPGAHMSTYAGGQDVFIVKLNSAGAIAWATLYGGLLNDVGAGVAVDASGNVFVAGNSASSLGISTPSSHQVSYAGGNTNLYGDGFLVKFDSLGVRQWGTYYGGSADDLAHGIAIDKSNNIIIIGETNSTSGISSAGAHKTALTGAGYPHDAFVAKFNTTGVRLWGTYYGGTTNDRGYAVTTDQNNIYFTGWAISSTANAISTSGSHQPTLNSPGFGDAFLAKLDSSGTRLWGTYYGGNDIDMGYGVAVDQSGYVLLTGYTASTNNISSAGSYQPALSGTNTDAFIVRFTSSGVRSWGTYYGDAGGENGYGIAADHSGNVYVCGSTSSSANIALPGASQVVLNGGSDAFLAVFSGAGVLPVRLTSFGAEWTAAQKNVQCRWTTASEANNSHFEIERSFNGKDFEPIGRVQGGGTTNEVRYYSFNDETGTLAGGVSLYYRLRQVDLGGAFTYSGIVVVSLKKPDAMNVYPNPFASDIFMDTNGPATIAVYDLTGKNIFNGSTDNGWVNLEHLTPGIYVLEAKQGDTTRRTKVLKNQ